MLAFVLLVASAAFFESTVAQTAVCGANERSTDCYNVCQDLTCKERITGSDRLCTQQCGTTGCICNEGFYRHDNGSCVPVNECSPPTCRNGEVYRECGSACPKTCDNKDDTDRVCTTQCVEGCFCAPDTIRAPDGSCVAPENCPLPEPTEADTQVCGVNERSTDCYNVCQDLTCKERITGSDRVCTQQCGTTGCICNEGFYRHDNGTCVSSFECSPPSCPKGEVYSNCGTACPATCEKRGNTCSVMCTLQCVEGCFCPPNTMRAPNGSCVAPRNCPKRTCKGANEIFVECPPTCPPTEACSNIWSRFDCSNASKCCAPQCRCKDGYYRNKDNVCISTKACMKTT